MKNEKIGFSTPKSPVHVYESKIGAHLGAKCDAHYHTEIELIYITNGCMVAYANGEKFILKKGSVFFVNSRVPHHTEILSENTLDILVQFRIPSNIDSSSVIKYLKKFMSTTEVPAYSFEPDKPETTEMIFYINNLLNEFNIKSTSYEYYMTFFLQGIIACLHRNGLLMDGNTVFDNKSIEKIYPVLQYIDSNYNESITLDDLSKMLNLNQFYFCRLFKKATNSTFVEYLNFVRVCKAEKILCKTDKSISEISYEVGFASLSYFNRTFKKYKSCSPTEYKRLSQIEDSLISDFLE